MFENRYTGSKDVKKGSIRRGDSGWRSAGEGTGDIFGSLRDTRVLASAGVLAAISIVLGFFKIPITQLIELRCAFIPIAVAAFLFGPVVGGMVGMISDVGGYIVKPTGPFFPGFTLTAIVSGLLFGLLLYRHRPTIMRILTSQVVYAAVCGLLLNTVWLSMLYGNGFIPVLSARIVKELVMIPINTAALAAILQPVKRFALAGD